MNAKTKGNIAGWIVLLSFMTFALLYKHYLGTSIIVGIVGMILCYAAIDAVEAYYKNQNANGMKASFKIG